ncbi:MAG: glucosaminidase domain-containing protein [Armatimonadetes bacterium]|nr:glucosaminidase domain-containing protein [Armatimonadota bacterium]
MIEDFELNNKIISPDFEKFSYKPGANRIEILKKEIEKLKTRVLNNKESKSQDYILKEKEKQLEILDNLKNQADELRENLTKNPWNLEILSKLIEAQSRLWQFDLNLLLKEINQKISYSLQNSFAGPIPFMPFNPLSSFPSAMLPYSFNYKNKKIENSEEKLNSLPISLKKNDQKLANFINNYLISKGSPAANKGAGEWMVYYGKKYHVDPLILLSIGAHETGLGSLGVGVRKMLGVGAYDNNPDGATPYDGLEKQIKYGAITFSNLRKISGISQDASLSTQLLAVNRAGWASDSKWHKGVAQHYNKIAGEARNIG